VGEVGRAASLSKGLPGFPWVDKWGVTASPLHAWLVCDPRLAVAIPLRCKPAGPPLRPQVRFASLARQPFGPPLTPEPLRPLWSGLRAGRGPAPAIRHKGIATIGPLRALSASDLSTHGVPG
jgi:hypothetical protein